MKRKYIFGPVPSRRLGRSLGIDLVPYKTCPLDCVYCECGATTRLTMERKEYVPLADVLAELDFVLASKPELDFITFSGAGEPSLHSGIGEIVKHIKTNYPQYKICLLTNGAFLDDPAFVEEAKDIDVVIPSLDASTDEEFQKINRPEKSFTLEKLINGIIYFRKHSKAKIYLEIFIVPGVNDSGNSAERFRKLAEEIRPDRIQLNSMDRPGTEKWVLQPDKATMQLFANKLKDIAPVDIASRQRREGTAPLAGKGMSFEEISSRIIEITERRPCTAADIAKMISVNESVLEPHLRRMEAAGLMESSFGERGLFYTVRKRQ